MIINIVSYRWQRHERTWLEGRAYSRVLPVECLLWLAQWNAGQTPWQRTELLTPRHAVI